MSFKSIAIVLIAISLASQAKADLLYTNGPVNGTFGGDIFSSGEIISDSFTLTQTSTITGVDFGAWTDAGVGITTVEYGIASAPGTYPMTGTATVTQGALIPGSGYDGEYDVRMDSFSTNNITLGPGTYYLVLQGAAVRSGFAYWDVNEGPSIATQSFQGGTGNSIASESFDILGTTSPVPGPTVGAGASSFAIAALFLGWLVRRRGSQIA
jgi:hypothetical protein